MAKRFTNARVDGGHQSARRHAESEASMNEEDKPTPADGQLVWVVVAFITLMLGLLTLRSCL